MCVCDVSECWCVCYECWCVCCECWCVCADVSECWCVCADVSVTVSAMQSQINLANKTRWWQVCGESSESGQGEWCGVVWCGVEGEQVPDPPPTHPAGCPPPVTPLNLTTSIRTSVVRCFLSCNQPLSSSTVTQGYSYRRVSQHATKWIELTHPVFVQLLDHHSSRLVHATF